MHIMPVMWIVWAGLATILFGLLAYRGSLTRYEDDLLYLDESSGEQQKQHDVLLNRVQRIRPMLRAAVIGTAAMTVAILGTYAYDAVQHLKM